MNTYVISSINGIADLSKTPYLLKEPHKSGDIIKIHNNDCIILSDGIENNFKSGYYINYVPLDKIIEIQTDADLSKYGFVKNIRTWINKDNLKNY